MYYVQVVLFIGMVYFDKSRVFCHGTCKREDGDIGNRFYSCFVRFPDGDGCCKGLNATEEAIAVEKDDSIKDGRLRKQCRANISTNSNIASVESCKKTVTNLPSLLSDLETYRNKFYCKTF